MIFLYLTRLLSLNEALQLTKFSENSTLCRKSEGNHLEWGQLSAWGRPQRPLGRRHRISAVGKHPLPASHGAVPGPHGGGGGRAATASKESLLQRGHLSRCLIRKKQRLSLQWSSMLLNISDFLACIKFFVFNGTARGEKSLHLRLCSWCLSWWPVFWLTYPARKLFEMPTAALNQWF